MKVLAWNMGQDPANWMYVASHNADIALLCEAPRPTSRDLEPIGEWRTRGLDCPHPDEPSCRCRPWSTAVASTYPVQKIEDARISRGVRKLFFGPSRPGSWIAAAVQVPGLGTVTAVSLYGLLDERSDASVHRSLSELAPLFERRRYNRHVLLGGDLNTLAIAKANSRRLAKDVGVLDRITKSFGLVDLLKKDLELREPPRGRLADCPCDFGDDCTHIWTHRRAGSSIPYQDDYLFASQPLADRLVSCRALPFTDESSSDHSPIVGEFK